MINRTFFSLLFLFSLNFLYAQHDVYNNSDWLNTKAINFQYDKAGNVDYREHLGWNSDKEKWDETSLKTEVFNDDNLSIENIQAAYDNNKEKYIQKRYVTTEIEKLGAYSIQKTSKLLDNKTNTFRPYSRLNIEFLDDAQKKITKSNSFSWNTKLDKWIDTHQTITEYDANKEPVNILRQKWVEKSHMWKNISHQEIHYSDNYRKKEAILKKWDTKNNQWHMVDKFEVIYNSKKNAVKSQSWYEWQEKKWTLVKKAMITQFEKNAEYSIVKKRITENTPWEYVSKTYFYYNEVGSIKDIVYQKWDSGKNEWFNTQRTKYLRNPLDVVEKEIYQVAVPFETIAEFDSNKSLAECLFPNPFYQGATINCNSLDNEKDYSFHVNDIEGSIIHEIKELKNNSYSIENHISSGIYLFTLKENGKIISSEKVTFQN